MVEEPGKYPDGSLDPGDPDNIPLDDNVYAAFAFRFGWLNQDVIFLGAGTRDDMKARAQLYWEWRGSGKYATGVFRNGDQNFENPLVYHSSSWREKKPRTSWRAWAAEHMGLMILGIAETGKDHQGNPVKLPAWIQELVDRAEMMTRSMSETMSEDE